MDAKIVVTDYSSQWPVQFEMLKNIYSIALQGVDTDIQHVGSTAVLGLAAKPIIDIDIIIDNDTVLETVIGRLENIGYKHRGDLGIPQREAFKHLTGVYNGKSLPAHNLYVCIKGCDSLNNHLTFRDYLKQHPGKIAEYSALKKRLAATYPNDIDAYVENKTPFITGILLAAGFDNNVVDAITNQNKA